MFVHFSCQLSGKSDIVSQQYIDLRSRENTTRQVGNITVTTHRIGILIDEQLGQKLAPKGRVSVWYKEGIEFLVDSADFGVATALQNKVIDFSEDV